MKTLILVRHGESAWNKLNLFTGWTDVDLTETGMQEAWEAGKLKTAVLHNEQEGQRIKVRTDVPVKVKGASSSTRRDGTYYLTTITMKPGRDCVLTAK